MSDGDDGHCKDTGHVRVLATNPILKPDPGVFSAVYVPTTTCVNVPSYDGWVVQLQHQVDPHPVQPGLRMLPELAEVFPTWLRRAAHRATDTSVNVEIQHTFDKVWRTYAVVSPIAARALAMSVLSALEQSPPGVNG